MKTGSIRALALAALALASPAAAQQGRAPADSASVEAPAGTVVLPPAPIPPAELLRYDLRVRRADRLLTRVEVLDAFAARFARQSSRLLAHAAPDCDATATLSAALELTLLASSAATRTVGAELALLPDPPQLVPLRERLDAARARSEDTQLAWPELREQVLARCPLQPTSPTAAAAAPTAWLPEDERGAVDGQQLVFVRASEPWSVIWLGGEPVAAADAQGWAAVVAPVGVARLCVAEPEETHCERGVEVSVSAAAAYDLSR